MRQSLLTLRGYFGVLLVDITARAVGRLRPPAWRPGRTSASILGASLAAALLLAAAIGLRTAGEAGPVRDAALTAPGTGGAAARAAGARPVQVEIGRREYLPGEAASASGSRPAPLEGRLAYLPGEGPAIAAGGATSPAGVRPAQDEIGRREYLPGEAASDSVSRPSALGGPIEYLPGERPTFATAARDGAGKLAYLPGEAAAGAGDVAVPLLGPQP
jgi:hypothetical protein